MIPSGNKSIHPCRHPPSWLSAMQPESLCRRHFAERSVPDVDYSTREMALDFPLVVYSS